MLVQTPKAARIGEQAVEAALAIAEEQGWESVRLALVAERAGLPLDELARRFRDVDALADAWFAQARLAMLSPPSPEVVASSADLRIAAAFGRWLDALAPHRLVAGEILRHKLYPSHPHHWVPMVFDLSRLVHDLLDVARVPGAGRLRQVQEIGLTAITLASLRDWLRDGSPGQEASRRRLQRRLTQAGSLAMRLQRRLTQAGSLAMRLQQLYAPHAS